MKGSTAEFVLGHRPALDGLRGVAVLLVVLCHLDLPWFNLRGGFIGVHFFFVLSGFLITSLLLEEWRRSASISLGAFYARRALRLLPALLLFLGTVVTVGIVTEAPGEARNIQVSALMTLFYSSNWFLLAGKFPAPALLNHCWSLSVEEQFYFVWPLVLLVLLRIKDGRRIIGAIVVSIAILAFWRAYVWLTSFDKIRVYFGSDMNANALLVGVLVAFLMSVGAYPKAPRSIKAVTAAGILVVLLTPVGLFKLTPYVSATLDWWVHVGGILAVDGGVGVLIVAILVSPLRTFFEHEPLVWIGRTSYGMYLWHYPILVWSRDPRLGLGPWADPAALALTLAATALSYYALERPLLKLKSRFSKVQPLPALPPSPSTF